MKVFLDDVRDPPNGWIVVRDCEACIDVLSKCEVTHLSLDHDLGDGETSRPVMRWLEDLAYNGIRPPDTVVHSDNPSGRKWLEQGIASMWRLYNSHD